MADHPDKPSAKHGLSQPPTAIDRTINSSTTVSAAAFGWATIALLVFIVWMIGWSSIQAFREFGLDLIFSTTYNPVKDIYGLWPQILGTLYSSLLALIVAAVIGVALAIFLSERFLPGPIETVLKNIVDLLAAIPSVVYGLWGIFVVIPWVEWLLRFFYGQDFSLSSSMLPAVLVLAIMVLPTIAAISRDALVAVDPKLRQAAYGLGATRWEAIFTVVLPTASPGIFGAIVLGFGRALGETMALAMLLGNVNRFSFSLLEPGNTLAALIANNFAEASGLQTDVLLAAGMVLLLLTLIVNIIGSLIIQFANRGKKGAAH